MGLHEELRKAADEQAYYEGQANQGLVNLVNKKESGGATTYPIQGKTTMHLNNERYYSKTELLDIIKFTNSKLYHEDTNPVVILKDYEDRLK